MVDYFFALLLPLIAGLATTIGSFIAFFLKTPSKQFISIIMGFSAGVMVLVSFVELLPTSIDVNGLVEGLLFFFVGMIIMLTIDVTISHQYEFEDSMELLTNPNGSCDYEYQSRQQHRHSKNPGKNIDSPNHQKLNSELYYPIYEEQQAKEVNPSRHRYRIRHSNMNTNNNVSLEKTSLLVFLGIFIHNIPEGMATFIGSLRNIELGVVLALAIALHNIPEGIAVSVPIYVCTGSRKKAFFWSFLSGISEFFGAVFVGLIFFPFINDASLGIMLAIVAGIMIYISLDELLPVSHSLGEEHHTIIGLMIGMFVMAVSIVLL